MKSVKVCILIRALCSGGAEKQSVLLANALSNFHQVFFVVQRGSIVEKKYYDFLNDKHIKLVLLKGGLVKRLFVFLKFLKEKEIHIVFSFLTSDNFYAAIIGKLAGTKHIIGSIRSNRLPWHKFIITKFLHRLFMDYIIFNSYSGYDNFINQGYIKEKSLVINNYIDYHPAFIKREPKNKLIILTVARFTEQKDYYTTIKSIYFFIRNLCPDEIRVEYRIIGFGKLEKQINKWIDDFGLSDDIQVFVKPNNLEEKFINADIYLSTSIFEGFSNSIMEAMNYSLPVIATDVGDNSKLVISNETGYLTKIKDHEVIAEKIFDLVVSYEKRIQFGKAGYKLLKNQYSKKAYTNRYMRLINTLDQS